jgi:putative transcriptional regulator
LARAKHSHYFGASRQSEGTVTVAIVRMTMEEIRARAASRTPEEDAEFRRRMDGTTEEDIRRHMIEDGEDPDEEPRFELAVLPQDVRKKLGMTQADFAALLRVPIGTLRNWEQNRFVMEPAAQTLLKLIYREPEAALRALREPHAA